MSQELKKVVKISSYKDRVLIEEFKQDMNGIISQKLMKAERPPRNINSMNKQPTLIDNGKRTSEKRKDLVERLLPKNRN